MLIWLHSWTVGQMIWGIHCIQAMKNASNGSILAAKSRTEVTRSPSKRTKVFKKISKQECISEGCVPSAAVAGSWGGSCLLGGTGVCPGGFCQWGVSARGGVCLGVSAQGGVCQTPPWTEWQTGLKTLPCLNYVADGKKWNKTERLTRLELQTKSYWTPQKCLERLTAV